MDQTLWLWIIGAIAVLFPMLIDYRWAKNDERLRADAGMDLARLRKRVSELEEELSGLKGAREKLIHHDALIAALWHETVGYKSDGTPLSTRDVPREIFGVSPDWELDVHEAPVLIPRARW